MFSKKEPMSKSNKPVIKSLADADSGYVAAKALVDKLGSQRSKLDAEENALLERLRNRGPAPEQTSRVAMLLGDALPADNVEPDGLRARLTAIAAERADLRAAIEIANQRLATARHRASATICGEVKPAYQAAVKNLADQLIAADAAHRRLVEIIDALNAADVAWTGHLPPAQATGILGERGVKVARWLHDVARHGFVKKADIPKELQQ